MDRCATRSSPWLSRAPVFAHAVHGGDCADAYRRTGSAPVRHRPRDTGRAQVHYQPRDTTCPSVRPGHHNHPPAPRTRTGAAGVDLRHSASRLAAGRGASWSVRSPVVHGLVSVPGPPSSRYRQLARLTLWGRWTAPQSPPDGSTPRRHHRPRPPPPVDRQAGLFMGFADRGLVQCLARFDAAADGYQHSACVCGSLAWMRRRRSSSSSRSSFTASRDIAQTYLRSCCLPTIGERVPHVRGSAGREAKPRCSSLPDGQRPGHSTARQARTAGR